MHPVQFLVGDFRTQLEVDHPVYSPPEGTVRIVQLPTSAETIGNMIRATQKRPFNGSKTKDRKSTVDNSQLTLTNVVCIWYISH